MKRNYINCKVGDKFNFLTILNWEPRNKDNVKMVKCLCDCGNTTIIKEYLVKMGIRKHCGCIKNKTNSTHGMWNTPEWISYTAMKTRCLNKNDKAYWRYGGRGITICKRWLESFENFYSDMGNRPGLNYSLDRINNDGNYEPSNCRWADYITQNNNRKSSRYIEYNGKTQSIAQWAREFNIPKHTLLDRLKTRSLPEAINFSKEIYTLIDYAELKRLTEERRSTNYMAIALKCSFTTLRKALKYRNLEPQKRGHQLLNRKKK